jgi:hypothetical protein
MRAHLLNAGERKWRSFFISEDPEVMKRWRRSTLTALKGNGRREGGRQVSTPTSAA